jgi:hypothetical protein
VIPCRFYSIWYLDYGYSGIILQSFARRAYTVKNYSTVIVPVVWENVNKCWFRPACKNSFHFRIQKISPLIALRHDRSLLQLQHLNLFSQSDHQASNQADIIIEASFPQESFQLFQPFHLRIAIWQGASSQPCRHQQHSIHKVKAVPDHFQSWRPLCVLSQTTSSMFLSQTPAGSGMAQTK